ncbi:hypothetical protein FEM48_Zijuj06G0040400 [Ziziphus jujuba var. spinosa]|uniref:Subtilisin-like protease SBT1.7 n=1 Tax=Ziziphus jujuba var. spinosa TaxID=714518 RepID=A0A978V723_ZIZJJ|nr:hypothetical protein FEM48_Zijuj06G0040400 [Ziziphus jujuba var. spinosa]
MAEDGRQQPKNTYMIHMDKSNMPSSFRNHLQCFIQLGHQISLDWERKSEALFPAIDKLSEVVIGVIDTGVWPESESYDDTGLGPIPSGWKGKCELSNNFNSSNCNRKLICARFFSRGYTAAFGHIDNMVESESPRDNDCHGTHTSTTAARSAVAEVSLFGYASGTARGTPPQARIATYKVCWLRGCLSSDVLAAIDEAIEDGVDILSMSIGGGLSTYYRDPIASGAFSAMPHGIPVSCSAGNPGSLSNVAPWITTVGAGTLDRNFTAYISLGNGNKYKGISLYTGKSELDLLFPLVYGDSASNSTSGNLCLPYSLIPEKVAGKIVICDRGANPRILKGQVVKNAGGARMILTHTDSHGEVLVADVHLLPTAAVGKKIGDAIKSYLKSDTNPTAKISFGGTRFGIKPSAVVASFSSREPNPLAPEILKPDLIAPGMNILAGWTNKAGPTGLGSVKRCVSFNIISGTSMSCPHVSGLAALLKAEHPEWSPTAIRSTLMKTAYITYKNGEIIQDFATGNPATPFDYGAGHVDPVAALDPGLVYDAGVQDYLSFPCALNYDRYEIILATNVNFKRNSRKKYSLRDFNYPSFAVPLQTALGKGGAGVGVSTSVKYTRTLTNVGAPAKYKVSVSSKLSSVKILVEPQLVSFSQTYEKKTHCDIYCHFYAIRCS